MFRLIITLFFCSILASPAFAEEPDKWEGYIEFMAKPGTARSLGQSDLFIPLMQGKKGMTFFNLRGKVQSFDFNEGEYNIGGGHRQIIDKWIYGVNAFYDGRISDTGHGYNQLGLGIEALSEDWDFRANGYIPDEEENETDRSAIFSHDTKIARIDVSTKSEKSLAGFDAEVGYRLPLENINPLLSDTRIYAGLFHFFGDDGFEDIAGPRFRAETRIHDLPYLGAGSRLMAGVEFQSDSHRGDQTAGMLSLRIPFGAVQIKRTVLASTNKLERRMMEPVVRDVDVVIAEKNSSYAVVQETLPDDSEIPIAIDVLKMRNPEGLFYTHVLPYYSTMDYVAIVNDVKAKMQADPTMVPLVEISDPDGQTNFVVDCEGNSINCRGLNGLPSHSTFAMAGKELRLYYEDPEFGIQNLTYTPDGFYPHQEYPFNSVTSPFGLEDGAHINGWNIDVSDTTYQYGLDLGGDPGTFYITNTEITGGIYGGLRIKPDQIVFADRLTINSPDLGIYIYGNPYGGVAHWAELNITNSSISGNNKDFKLGTFTTVNTDKATGDGALYETPEGSMTTFNIIGDFYWPETFIYADGVLP